MAGHAKQDKYIRKTRKFIFLSRSILELTVISNLYLFIYIFRLVAILDPVRAADVDRSLSYAKPGRNL